MKYIEIKRNTFAGDKECSGQGKSTFVRHNTFVRAKSVLVRGNQLLLGTKVNDKETFVKEEEEIPLLSVTMSERRYNGL